MDDLANKGARGAVLTGHMKVSTEAGSIHKTSYHRKRYQQKGGVTDAN